MSDVPEMVERIAAAMHDRFHEEAGKVMGLSVPPTKWAQADPPCRRFYLASARAGLKMMREPTEAMIAAGTAGRKAVESILAEPNTRATYAGMIEAALSPPLPSLSLRQGVKP